MAFKRLFDILFSGAGLAATAPILVLMAVIIRLSSPGPVFFIQKRIGRNSKTFSCIKFRTMKTGAEADGSITSATDTRITGIGRVLRKLKLDELPQLWNVLLGNMSFVGPRPDVPGYADKLEGEDRKILELRPGITGPASIFFRDEEELLAKVPDAKKYNDEVIWPIKVAINKIYLEEWGFLKDLGYILITVFPGMDGMFGLMRRFDEFKVKLEGVV